MGVSAAFFVALAAAAAGSRGHALHVRAGHGRLQTGRCHPGLCRRRSGWSRRGFPCGASTGGGPDGGDRAGGGFGRDGGTGGTGEDDEEEEDDDGVEFYGEEEGFEDDVAGVLRPREWRDPSLRRIEGKARYLLGTEDALDDFESAIRRRQRRKKFGMENIEVPVRGIFQPSPAEAEAEDMWRWQSDTFLGGEEGEEGEDGGDGAEDGSSWAKAPPPVGDDGFWVPPTKPKDKYGLVYRSLSGVADDIRWFGPPTGRLVVEDMILMVLGSIVFTISIGVMNVMVDFALADVLHLIPKLNEYPAGPLWLELLDASPEELKAYFEDLREAQRHLADAIAGSR